VDGGIPAFGESLCKAYMRPVYPARPGRSSRELVGVLRGHRRLRAGFAWLWLALILLSAATGVGCRTTSIGTHHLPVHAAQELMAAPVEAAAPRELCKVTLPTYRIEPPDVLAIDAIHIVPRPPYRLRAMDLIFIQAQGTLPDAPINGVYRIEPGGVVKLGFYGAVSVVGLTVNEAESVITRYLRSHLKEPVVSVSLAEIAAKQQITGQHLVAPDGAVTLGSYGRVQVAGLTIDEARLAIQNHLAQFLDAPEISVDVYAYNSKVYYVIIQGAGLGDGVYRFPVTGNETVLDAISHINGLQQVSSKRIWVARPTDDPRVQQILPVDWEQITACGIAATNYQLLPGDRVFVQEDKLVAFDVGLAKLTAPLERVLGFTLLGTGTVTRLSGKVLQGGGNPRSTF